jgi:outer membrane protein assembly factor BamE (lipoprotein component of BamABCDE complex)
MKRELTLRLTALLICLLSAGQALADSVSEANAARIEKLEALVSSLEKRVSALESPSGQIPASVQGVQNQSAWENKTNWRSLRKGMKKAEVRSLLGEPDKIDATGPVEDWRWGGPTGPNLYFVNERLSGWSEPD